MPSMKSQESNPYCPTRFPICQALVVLLLTALAFGCTTDGGPNAHDPGLLQAPGFDDGGGRLVRPWLFSEHGGGNSYELEISDGVAAMRRFGKESWARLAQSVSGDRLAPVSGRTMAFSIDIRNSPGPAAAAGSSKPNMMAVQAWGRPAGDNSRAHALLGPKLILNERLELDASAGSGDWQRHTIEFRVPERATRLEVSAVMRSFGRMELRNPALVAVTD